MQCSKMQATSGTKYPSAPVRPLTRNAARSRDLLPSNPFYHFHLLSGDLCSVGSLPSGGDDGVQIRPEIWMVAPPLYGAGTKHTLGFAVFPYATSCSSRPASPWHRRRHRPSRRRLFLHEPVGCTHRRTISTAPWGRGPRGHPVSNNISYNKHEHLDI